MIFEDDKLEEKLEEPGFVDKEIILLINKLSELGFITYRLIKENDIIGLCVDTLISMNGMYYYIEYDEKKSKFKWAHIDAFLCNDGSRDIISATDWYYAIDYKAIIDLTIEYTEVLSGKRKAFQGKELGERIKF